MIQKLRRRFMRAAMVSVTLVLVLMGLSINVINFLSTNADLTSTLEMIHENQGVIPQFPGGGPKKRLDDRRFSSETPFSTRYFVLRYTAGGTLEMADMRHIAAVTEADAGDFLAVALAHGEGMGFTGPYKYAVTADGEGRFTAIFLDCQRELRSVRTFALISLLVVAASVCLVYLLIRSLSKKAMEPTVQSVERQKQFITDAGHELKTPLTVIATSLKVLEMEVGPQKWIDKAQGQTEKMAGLVNELVTLSRLDEETPALTLADFDATAAVTETAESFRDFAAARGRELELDIAPGLTYRGDEAAVRQLVSILLDNAVKYADGDGPIRLRLARGKRGLVLQTSNPCSGLAEEDLDRLFDRFYRPDRSRSAQTGGFGVGLSIARSIAEVHKGSIQAKLLPGGAIQFTAALR